MVRLVRSRMDRILMDNITTSRLKASMSIFGDGSTLTIGAILDSDTPTTVNEIAVEQRDVETNKKLNWRMQVVVGVVLFVDAG